VSGRYPGVYQARKAKYQRSKGKKMGHQRLLEWKGENGGTKAELTRMISISGSSRGARGTMHGANRALNFAGRNGMPDLRKELLAVSPDEERALALFVENYLLEFLWSDDGARVKREIPVFKG
jgi:hypothetical protein